MGDSEDICESMSSPEMDGDADDDAGRLGCATEHCGMSDGDSGAVGRCAAGVCGSEIACGVGEVDGG